MKYDVDTCKNYDYSKSSMAENREFLYNLVAEIEPKRIVELGTYYGCSYFAFAQAIKDYMLDKTQLIGVDTWEGDIHSNFYDDTVYETFERMQRKHFALNATLDYNTSHIRSTFAEAVDTFEDNSIDVLMIDGEHTLEAAKRDFEMYLPKLAKNGIVLFHDTNVNRFTLKNYWEKISKKYISYNFDNRYGLGVLAPKGVANYEKIQKFFKSPPVAIYTAIYGGKDDLNSQVFQNIPVTKIAFTDREIANDKGWNVVNSPFTKELLDSNPELKDPRMQAKAYKVRPQYIDEGFQGDYLIWIDGNIQIKNTRFVEFLIESVGDSMVGFMDHPDRDCIYEEYDACIKYNRLKTKEQKDTALQQLIRYKKEKVMPHSGLFAGTIFIRNMKHPRIEEFNDMWWSEILNGSFRDQLSLPYVLSKMGETPAKINLNLWNNECFKIKKHLV